MSPVYIEVQVTWEIETVIIKVVCSTMPHMMYVDSHKELMDHWEFTTPSVLVTDYYTDHVEDT